jgi:DHA2 family multidrug resistance protein
MAAWHAPQGPFDIPDVPNFVPRRLKPWLFIFFVLLVQFSGGVYLAAASDMVGTTALMQEDILMAGYASLIGMSVNFAVMFRIKFRFSNRTQLLSAAMVLIAANMICAHTASVPVLVLTCFVAGWFRMQATFACNSTIQLWLTPVRDMAIFFCYVYIVVDGVIQLSGIATIYTAFFSQWEYMHWIMTGLLVLMMVMVILLVRPVRGPMYIPLLGIDWIGSLLWAGFMMSFTFVCVYGNFYDWWYAPEIWQATVFGLVCAGINLWRATFLHHPYISYMALTNRNVRRATAIYLVFFTLMATEHVFEHTYAANILGFDETNLIDLNWYVLAGIIVGCAFTYFTFALRKWRYKTMTAIGFALAVVYLAWFYFFIDYGVEKEMLFLPLFFRGAASVIISIVFLTSIVQSGLPFQVFPQALTINGFTGAVMGATFGPAVVGELLRHTMARNAALLSSAITDFNPDAVHIPLGQMYGMVQLQAMIVSMKEIYGWLLILGLTSLVLILVSYSPLRPWAIFPKWKTIRRVLRGVARG